MTYIVSKYRTKKEADIALKLLRATRGKSKLFRNSELEDFLFGKLIDEGMKEKKEVPMEKIYVKLRK